MIVDGLTLDGERMRAHDRRLFETDLLAKLGGYHVNTAQPIASFEGTTAVNHRTAVLRFPCLANARTFWFSRVYQETVKPLRLNPMAADLTVRIYPEVALPASMAGKVADPRYRVGFPAAGVETLPEPSAGGLGQERSQFRRTTLVVADIDRSLRFYRDVLGLTAHSVRALDAKGSGRAIFALPPQDAARFVTLDAGAGQREMLGLVESPSYRPPASPGIRGVALVLKLAQPLDQVVPRLASTGATVFAPTKAGANNEQAVLDPDGHLVVLYELPR